MDEKHMTDAGMLAAQSGLNLKKERLGSTRYAKCQRQSLPIAPTWYQQRDFAIAVLWILCMAIFELR